MYRYLILAFVCLGNPGYSDVMEESPEFEYCLRNPITGGTEGLGELSKRDLNSLVSNFPGDSYQNRLKIVAWRALCGPELKYFWQKDHQWNIKPSICHYEEAEDGNTYVRSEGQFSHHIRFYPDRQHYYGFAWKLNADQGIEMIDSYMYHSRGQLREKLQKTIMDPTLYQIFRRGCTAAASQVNRSCPLPATFAEVEMYSENLRKMFSSAKENGGSLLDALGIAFPKGGEKDSSIDEVAAMASSVGLTCLAEAQKVKSSVGLNSLTMLPNFKVLVAETVRKRQPMVRQKIFGHYWDIGVPVFSDRGDRVEVCGKITRSQRFDLNDPISYRYVYKKSDIYQHNPAPVEAEFSDVNKSILEPLFKFVGSVVALLEFYGQMSTPEGDVPQYLALIRGAAPQVAALASRVKELSDGDWREAGQEFTYSYSFMGAKSWVRYGARDEYGELISTGLCPSFD